MAIKAAAEPTREEIRFISLPSLQQISDALQRQEGNTEAKVERYRWAMYRIQAAQRKAAVIAAEALRPDDLRHARLEYQDACRRARLKFEDEAVKVFSEVCTKGL